MSSQLADITWLILIIVLCLYWWSAQGVKQIAFQATKAYCRQMDVQMLDDCVVLSRYWFKRDERGKIRVWRSFDFEFSSTGEHRYSGRVILLGRKVLGIQLEPHRI